MLQAHHSHTSSSGAMNGGAIPPLNHCLHGIVPNCIIKYRDNFIFILPEYHSACFRIILLMVVAVMINYSPCLRDSAQSYSIRARTSKSCYHDFNTFLNILPYKKFISVRFFTVIKSFQAAMKANCWGLICCMNIRYVAGLECAISVLFQYIAFIVECS
jgi:hypothetical protein